MPPAETDLTMSKSIPEQNKAMVLNAFNVLFNERDYAAAEQFWSPNYITVLTSNLVARDCSISFEAFRPR